MFSLITDTFGCSHCSGGELCKECLHWGLVYRWGHCRWSIVDVYVTSGDTHIQLLQKYMHT